MSQLTFGTYAHKEDEVGIKIEHRIIEDNYKKPLSLMSRWIIAGAITSNGSSGAMQTEINALDAAYRDGGQNGKNATFIANGHTHSLNSAGSLTGVRVARFGYSAGAPWKMHTELSNRRAFYAVLHAEYRFSTSVMAYKERITQVGTGGPKWRYMPSLTGQPQYQTLQLNTSSKYVQQGMLMLRSSLPVANAPLFNDANIHHDQTRFIRHAPQFITNNGTSQVEEGYMVEWVYFAESYPQMGAFGNFNTPKI